MSNTTPKEPDFFVIIEHISGDDFSATFYRRHQNVPFIDDATDVPSILPCITTCLSINATDDSTITAALDALEILDKINDNCVFQEIMEKFYNQGFEQGMDICSNVRQFLKQSFLSYSDVPDLNDFGTDFLPFAKDHILRSKEEIQILMDAFPETVDDAALAIKCPSCWRYYEDLKNKGVASASTVTLGFIFMFDPEQSPEDADSEQVFFEAVWAAMADITGETPETLSEITQVLTQFMSLASTRRGTHPETKPSQLNENNWIQSLKTTRGSQFNIITKHPVQKVLNILDLYEIKSVLTDVAPHELPYLSVTISPAN